jgi:hypothetical protein
MNKKIAQKQIDKAVKKQVTMPVRKPVQNLLVVTIVINRDTGKVLDIVSKPSICNNNLTVENIVDKSLEDCIKILDSMGYDVFKRK